MTKWWAGLFVKSDKGPRPLWIPHPAQERFFNMPDEKKIKDDDETEELEGLTDIEETEEIDEKDEENDKGE